MDGNSLGLCSANCCLAVLVTRRVELYLKVLSQRLPERVN
jgi:hypothetical protein